MAEAGRPNDTTPLAVDDMIGSLATQVRELSLRVADLEGQLEAARRRIAVYEEFDAQVQDSLSAALRAANQIRERARISAEAIAQEARAQRPSDARALDAMRIERDALRLAIENASTVAPSRASTPAAAPVFPMSEMRTAATEALRGVFKELVAEIRATTPAAQAAAPAAPPRQSWVVPPSAPQPVYAPPPAPRPVVAPPQPAAVVRDIEVTPALAAPAPTPVPPPAPAPPPMAAAPQPAPRAVPEPAREEWVTPSEPVGEIQVVLSPISSFPRLVELERRLQGMPAVRTVYARDFRNGVATLAIGLRSPMTVDEFATAVTRLEYPRLRVVSTTGYVLELRIDSEASSIA